MSSQTQAQVLVCGAGPAGLVAALSLAKNGIAVRLIEKENEYQTGTRGAGLMPRSLEIFASLGVLPDILKTAHAIPPRRQYDGLRVVKTWELGKVDPVTPSTPYPNAVLNSQSSTGAALRKALAHYGVEVELGTEIESLTQDDSSVTVTLVKTTADGAKVQETAEVSYVIGTDGAKGVTRKLAGIGFPGESQPQKFVVADAIFEGLSPEYWHVFGEGSKVMLQAKPIGDPNDRLFTIITGGAQADLEKLVAEGLPELRRLFAELSQNPDITVEELRWMSLFKPSFRCAETFSAGRVFIGGDNAHVHSPMGGQGLNTSIQDSINLAWKMALVLKEQSPASLLDSYSDDRIPVVKCMLGISQKLHVDQNVKGIAGLAITPKPETTAERPHAAAPEKRQRRDSGGPKGGEPRSNIVKMLGVNYRWSGIVVDSRSGANDEASKVTAYGIEGADPTDVHAGDRAPDAPVTLMKGEQTNTTLFNLFTTTNHTALVFVRSDLSGQNGQLQLQLEALRAFGENIVVYSVAESGGVQLEAPGLDVHALVDSERHAFAGYGIDKATQGSGATVVIVRPDGVVGAFVFDAAGIQQYFAKVFGAK